MQIGMSWLQPGQQLEVQEGYKSCKFTLLFQCLVNYLCKLEVFQEERKKMLNLEHSIV